MLFAKACLCQYLGTAYAGWQRQKNGKAIQELIENALSAIYADAIKIAGSGRTDAGVHAMGVVFSFSSKNYRTNEALIRGCRAYLPQDVGIIEAKDVKPSFHAGKNIKSKTYLYKIINSPVPAPLYTNRALWIRKPINIVKLNEILKVFQGTNDFESFCVKKTKKENTIRTVFFTEAIKKSEEIDIEINASGFLHNMVRIIVGTAVKILQLDGNPQDALDMLQAKDRRKAGPTAPAYGLYQKEAIYNLDGVADLEGIPKEFL